MFNEHGEQTRSNRLLPEPIFEGGRDLVETLAARRHQEPMAELKHDKSAKFGSTNLHRFQAMAKPSRHLRPWPPVIDSVVRGGPAIIAFPAFIPICQMSDENVYFCMNVPADSGPTNRRFWPARLSSDGCCNATMKTAQLRRSEGHHNFLKKFDLLTNFQWKKMDYSVTFRLVVREREHHIMRRLILAGACAVALTGAAAAESWSDFETGIHAYQIGAYRDALQYLKPMAIAGNSTAQYWLGIMYYEGKGVTQDDVEAYMWLTLAADQGNRGARLGKNGLARRMNAEEVATAERRMRIWLADN